MENNPTILVVDDDPFVREILEFVLQAGGYTVYVAGDGDEALGKCEPGLEIDAIVSDLNMPGMSGLELMKELRRQGRVVPIIVLTGDNGLASAMEAVKNGASGYIVKDENLADSILDVLEKVLQGRGS